MSTQESHDWGRVDEEGNVFLKEGDTERHIGQYLDGSPEEALQFYARKFEELAGQVTLLEQRVQAGAKGHNLAENQHSLITQITGAAALGDLAALLERLNALTPAITELAEAQAAQNKAALEAAIAERETVVAAIEQLAATDKSKIKWKDIGNEIERLFTQWKQQQQEQPRFPKATADELWKRFRKARQTLEQNKRAFFQELDQRHKEAKDQKTDIVARAEALIARGADAAADYRKLLDEWKRAGRAGRKQDDALWERFKAAGDQIYAVKAEQDALENEEFEKNFEAKQAVLNDFASLVDEQDLSTAKQQWLLFIERWERIGRVPKNQMRTIDEAFGKIERHIRQLESDHWKKNNPETKARVEGLSAQLVDLIAKIEADLVEARAAGDAAQIQELEEALKARQAWLNAVSDD